MRWSENDRKVVREARRLRRNLRWGKGQLWVCVIAACAVAYLGARSNHGDTAGLLIVIGLYFVYRSLRMLMWRGQLKARLSVLKGARLFTPRQSVSLSRT
jgi:hypothetical protein